MKEYDFESYEKYKAKLSEIENQGKGFMYLFYLAIILCFIPAISIISIIIFGYIIERARRDGLLYGYYCGKIDEMTSEKYMFNQIKDGRLQ